MKFEGKLSDQGKAPPTVGDLFVSHAQSPRNIGTLETANGVAVGVGSCGDTLAVQLRVLAGRIEELKCLPNGCLYTIICASVMSELATGKDLESALLLQPVDIERVVGGLPNDHAHCARLAVNTLGEAIDDYYQRNGFPGE